MTRSSSSALAVVIALCGLASLACMFMVGRHQKSAVLVLMFTAWVAAPFVASAGVCLSGAAKRSLAWMSAVVALLSAGVYAAVVYGPPRTQPARFFLLVPAAAWLLLALAWVSQKRAKGGS